MRYFRMALYRALRWSEQYMKTDMVHFFTSNFWLNMSRIISVGTGMTLTVAFANLLTPETFGTYKYIIAAAGFVASFSLSGLGASLMRAVAQGKLHVIPSVVNTAMLWSIPATLAAFGVSTYYFVQGNSDLGFAFMFIAASNTFANGFAPVKAVWVGTGDFKTPTIAGIPRILVPFFIILLTILFTKNVVWILLAYFAANTIASFLGYRWTLWWLRVRGSQQDVDEVIRYGKQMTGLSFFQVAAGQLDQLLLWHFTDPATLAFYAIALSPVNEARNFLGNFFSIAFKKVATKTKEEVYSTLPFRLRQLTLASLGMTVVYIVLIPFLFWILFPTYTGAILISQILALSLLLMPKGIIDVYFTTHGEVKNRYVVILISQAVRLALIVLLIPFFGLWGAVAAYLLTEVVSTLLYLWMYYRGAPQSSEPESK
jgi:O-antigen/teichoic acid export membrane protein